MHSVRWNYSDKSCYTFLWLHGFSINEVMSALNSSVWCFTLHPIQLKPQKVKSIQLTKQPTNNQENWNVREILESNSLACSGQLGFSGPSEGRHLDFLHIILYSLKIKWTSQPILPFVSYLDLTNNLLERFGIFFNNSI